MQVLVVFRTRCGCVRAEMMDDCMLRREWIVPLMRPSLVSFALAPVPLNECSVEKRRFELHKQHDGTFLYQEV